MPNKPVRQSAKYREQQLRKRIAQGDRPAGTFDTAELDGAPEAAGTPSPDATTMRFSPSGTGTATVTRTTTLNRRPPGATSAAVTAARTARGRVAAQVHEMNLADEMAFIRADIRRLLILAAGSFVVLIVLSFLIK
jgi:hypothetical protein